MPSGQPLEATGGVLNHPPFPSQALSAPFLALSPREFRSYPPAPYRVPFSGLGTMRAEGHD
jgi:hypothetical protein